MAIPVIQHLVGGQNAAPISDLQRALAGVEGTGSADTWTFSDSAGHKVVFKGTFAVDNGDVVGGFATGFDVFDGAVKVMTGSGYALSIADVRDARDGAIADDYTVFYPTFFSEVRAVGSADGDRMYGATDKGKFFGMAGDDFLYGDAGKEVMKGGAADDWIEGRGAADKLFGNAGADTFAFTYADKGNDPIAEFSAHSIKDFDPREDTIFLDVGRFTALDAGALDTSEFGLGRKAKTSDMHVIFRKKTGDLYYDEDGAGGAKKVLIAELDPGLKLKAHHFDADLVS